MKKAEYIKRYGIEWYKRQIARLKAYSEEHRRTDPEYKKRQYACQIAYMKTRYHNDPVFRERMIANAKAWRIARRRAKYVEEGRIDLIEGYLSALADNFVGWEIHHRIELHPDGSVRFTKRSLIKLGLYYNRPPSELIWRRSSERL